MRRRAPEDRRSGVRDETEVSYGCATPGIFGVARYAEPLSRLADERHVNTMFRHNLTEIRAKSRDAVFHTNQHERFSGWTFGELAGQNRGPIVVSAPSTGKATDPGLRCRAPMGHKKRSQRHGGVMTAETARWYADKYGDHATNTMTVALAGLAANDLVLDIGCGSGSAVRAAAALVTSGRVVGVDPTPEMIRIATEQTESCPDRERISFHRCGAETLALADASVTVALAINSLHHWRDLAAGLAEVRRVLAVGGRFFVGDEKMAIANPLLDPAVVADELEAAGFVEIAISHHSEGAVEMFLVAARV